MSATRDRNGTMIGNGRQQGTSKVLEWLKAFTGAEKPAFVVAAALAFVVALYLLIMDHTASAVAAGALTLALLVFHNLPIMESFEVLGLKAKLVQRIGEAEQLLDHIRKSASASAKLHYIQLAWMNRMGTIDWSKKRELAAEMESVLRSLQIPQQEIDNTKLPFMILLCLDIYRVFESTLHERVQHYQSILSQEISEFGRRGPINQSDPQWKELMDRQQRLRTFQRYDSANMLVDQRLRDVDGLSREILANAPIPEPDKAALEPVRTQVSGLAAACWLAGTVTPEAEAYIERWEHKHPRYDELIAASAPSAP